MFKKNLRSKKSSETKITSENIGGELDFKF